MEKYQLSSSDGKDSVALLPDKVIVYVEGSLGIPEALEWTSYELRDDPEKNGTLIVETINSMPSYIAPWVIPSTKHAVIYVDRSDVMIPGLNG